MATVHIPTPLRRLTSGQSKIDVQGETIGSLIQLIDAQHSGVAEKVLDKEGNLKRFVNIYVNEDDIRELQGLETSVTDKDKISIVPAMAGGRG